MKFKLYLMGAAMLALQFSCTKDHQLNPVEEADLDIETRAQVVLPAGSVDGLAAAIAAAGPNGTVIVQSGTHYLNSTVEITHRVTIKGQPGAIIIADVPALLTSDAVLEPAFYINGGARTVIEGLDIRAANDPAGTAVLVFNAHQVTIRNNSFSNFQFTILVEQSNQATINNNTIEATFTWATVAFYAVHGIVIINGSKAQVRNNTVSQAVFGIWACDYDGIATGNEVFGNVLGLILCTVPPGSFPLPNGTLAGSAQPATKWTVTNNNAHNNFQTGFTVIDGANNCMLSNNSASNNAAYDVELAGDTERYGFPAPASYNNRVNIGGANAAMTVKDCGNNNIVNGGTPVDITADPCF